MVGELDDRVRIDIQHSDFFSCEAILTITYTNGDKNKRLKFVREVFANCKEELEFVIGNVVDEIIARISQILGRKLIFKSGEIKTPFAK